MRTVKRILLAAAALICAASCALADGAPASQFGFSIWPYRQSAPCARATTPSRNPTVPQPTAKPAETKKPVSSADVGDYTTLSLSAQEYSAWNLLNADREAHGLPALPLDEELCALARIKSTDMKENRYFAHRSPTFGRAADMLKTFGYSFRSVAENIAHHATVEKSQAAFMSSDSHRTTILGRQWSRVGVGVCLDDQGFVYVTQLFVR